MYLCICPFRSLAAGPNPTARTSTSPPSSLRASTCTSTTRAAASGVRSLCWRPTPTSPKTMATCAPIHPTRRHLR